MKVEQSDQKRGVAEAVAALLAERPEVAAVELFGSVARGSAQASSDIDLLIVVDGSVPVRSSSLFSELPTRLQRPDLSLSIFTLESLREYLHRWSRFAVHLRREGIVLYDPTKRLTALLAEDMSVSVTHELNAQRSHLENFAHLDRFGDRFLFPLAHLYGIGRTVVFARLAQYGRLEFDRDEAFQELKTRDPELVKDICTIEALEPFYDCVRHADPSVKLPFSPVGEEAERRAAEAHDAVTRILVMSGTLDARH